MDAKFLMTNETPIAVLTVGQFKELISSLIDVEPANKVVSVKLPETFGKKECSQFTGYAVNTINKMICEKTIPFYKRNARVIFKRDEIQEWLLSNRVQTVEEFLQQKEANLAIRRASK